MCFGLCSQLPHCQTSSAVLETHRQPTRRSALPTRAMSPENDCAAKWGNNLQPPAVGPAVRYSLARGSWYPRSPNARDQGAKTPARSVRFSDPRSGPLPFAGGHILCSQFQIVFARPFRKAAVLTFFVESPEALAAARTLPNVVTPSKIQSHEHKHNSDNERKISQKDRKLKWDEV